MKSAASGLNMEEGAAVRQMLDGWDLGPAMDAYLAPDSGAALCLGQARGPGARRCGCDWVWSACADAAGGGIEVEMLLFTGGGDMPSGGGSGGSSSSSSSSSMRGGGGSAAGASSTVCLESCITVGGWAGHYYTGVLQEDAVCVLLPDDEQMAARATALAADSACKALGMAFRMGMVPAHLRRCLVEVSSATYLTHGTTVPLQPEPCAGFKADIGLAVPVPTNPLQAGGKPGTHPAGGTQGGGGGSAKGTSSGVLDSQLLGRLGVDDDLMMEGDDAEFHSFLDEAFLGGGKSIGRGKAHAVGSQRAAAAMSGGSPARKQVWYLGARSTVTVYYKFSYMW
ncbi:hypothetical protein HXX76_012070 [Chlamydomonas incerta]|uniref:Uncharacterized protein n=1 Tax=Chlamydomonas incerta TaxID=51695 RepID=A0A835SWC8_CHLIN|nr:hypothetical protein HXX76_012070 [Chlamydomonas incerta]|eukprot:KAG2427745.1 hypothetical protein HXX76_012070 [Chlamydomonas incerta]